MKHSIIGLLIAASVVGLPAGLALATDPHAGGTTGQPTQSCEDSTRCPRRQHFPPG